MTSGQWSTFHRKLHYKHYKSVKDGSGCSSVLDHLWQMSRCNNCIYSGNSLTTVGIVLPLCCRFLTAMNLSHSGANFGHFETGRNLLSAETEEVSWLSNEAFLPLKTLHLDELSQLHGIFLPEFMSMCQGSNKYGWKNMIHSGFVYICFICLWLITLRLMVFLFLVMYQGIKNEK